MNFSFESFVNGSFDYDKATQTHSCLWLREEKMDIGGGTISIEDLIFDRATDSIYNNADFPDHNSARERLSMGALMALSLRICYDKKREESLRKHREFIEREILDLNSGYVIDGVNRNTVRLYNFPWVSTYYLEWYNFQRIRNAF